MADMAYDLAVRLSLSTSGLMTGVDLAMRAFRNLESGAGSAARAADALGVRAAKLEQQLALTVVGSQRYFDLFGQSTVATAEHTSAVNAATEAHNRLNQAMVGGAMIAGGAVMTGAGVGILSFLDKATQQAKQFDLTLLGVVQRLTDGSGFGLSPAAQLAAQQSLSVQAAKVGAQSSMSMQDEANIMAAAAGAGITSRSTLAVMLQPLSNLAEVLYLGKGEDPSQSATVATEFAHLFGAYGSKQIGGVSDTAFMTNLLTRALYTTPASPTQFLNLVSQYAGPLRLLYGQDQQQKVITQSIETAAMLSRLGQQTRGGLQFAQMVNRLAGGGKASVKGLQEIQHVAGVGSFFNAQGQLVDVPVLVGALAKVATDKHLTPQQEAKIFYDAFGQVGDRLAGSLANATTQSQLGIIANMLGPNGLPNEHAIQQAYNKSPAGQQNQAQKNWQSFETMIGLDLLPAFQKLVQAEVQATKGLIDFALQHPHIMQIATDVALVAGAVATIAGPALMVIGLIKILGEVGPIMALANAIKAVSLSEVAAEVATVAWGAAGAIFGTIAAGVDVATLAFAALDLVLAPFIIPIIAIVAAVGTTIYVFSHWTDISKTLGTVFGWLGDKLHGFLVYLGLAHDGPRDKAQSTVGATAGDTAVVDGHTYRRTVGYRGIGSVVDERLAGS